MGERHVSQKASKEQKHGTYDGQESCEEEEASRQREDANQH